MRHLWISFFLLFTAQAAMAMDVTKPENVGLSSEKLAAIDTALNADIAAGKISGATLSIMRKGKLAYHKAFGTRGKDGAAGPLKTDDIFRIYSMTKPLTSVAIMMLVEEGKIGLDDPVSAHIPAFANAKVLKEGKLIPAENAITVKDLLRHTSGIVYGFFGDTPVRTEYNKVDLYGIKQSTGEMVAKLASLPLEHQPGTTWEYSHSTDVLGHVVEIVSKQSLDIFFRDRILTPLEMQDTGFYVSADQKDRIVEPTFKGLSNPLIAPNLLSGGGGLMSTAPDYLKFTTMLINKGRYNEKILLKPETVEKMTRDQLGDIKPGNYNLLGKENGFGLGFSVRLTDAGTTRGTKGGYWWGGYAGTYFWVDPAKELITVFMMQQPELRAPMRLRVRNWVYGALTD